MASGGHGLPKVLLGLAMHDPSMPCGQPPLKRPYGYFMGSHLQVGRPAAVFYPFGHPTPITSVNVVGFPLSLFLSLSRSLSLSLALSLSLYLSLFSLSPSLCLSIYFSLPTSLLYKHIFSKLNN